MNRKLEDAMVRLAFGDVTPEEVVALEREAAKNPEAARTLASYRRMRDGLRDLYDVPADQLSKERLRDAILSSGLKPQPTQSQRGWVWMPVAAAALVFGITMMRHNNSMVVPTVVGGSDAVALHNSAPIIDFRQGPDSKATGPVARNDVRRPLFSGGMAPETKSVSRKTSRHSHRRVEEDAAELQDLVARIMPDNSGDDMPPDMKHPSANAAVADTSAKTSTETAAQPIVLIEGAKDNDTGAQKATEVDSSKNVRTSG
jgi:hypothetical protein